MKNALRWTLSLSFLALIAVACQQAADSPTAPSKPSNRADDGSGSVAAQAGPSGPTNAGPGSSGAGPGSGSAGPGTGGTNGGTPTPIPTPTPGGTPTPTVTPTPPDLQVTSLSVSTGSPYEIVVNNTDCCSNSMGRAWLDYPYVLQSNFGASPPNEPLIMIRTAIADTNAPDDPLLSFSVNRCARVSVIFEPYVFNNADIPQWIVDNGFTCGSTVETFYHETFGSSDQTTGRTCSKLVTGNVQLGPRNPVGSNDHMYTVFVNVPLGTCP